MKIAVLGCGLVGSAMALDLARTGHQVKVADLNQSSFERLNGGDEITTIQGDLSQADVIQNVIADSDIVIGAVPGFMGYQTVKTVLEAKRDIVDISFFPEDPFALQDIAGQNGVTAILDCGVAPGFSHVAFGYLSHWFDEPQRLACYVGGLPAVRVKPFEYRIVFSALDVIEEYTRPARIVENGSIVIKEALSEIEQINFPGVGTLEAFNSDGLRSLTRTLGVPHMIEKTMRYPGHAEKMKLLREVGLLDKEPVLVDGEKVIPLHLTAELLFPQLKLEDSEDDLTIMRIVGEGQKAGKRQRVTFDLLDRRDPETGITSMARTTGYTATSVTELFLQDKIKRRGFILPEHLGQENGFIELLLDELESRGVIYKKTVEVIA